MAYKQKGWSPFTKKTDPVKKPVGPVTPSTKAEYMERQVWNEIEKQKRKKKGGVTKTMESLYENQNFVPGKVATSMSTMTTSTKRKKKKSDEDFDNKYNRANIIGPRRDLMSERPRDPEVSTSHRDKKFYEAKVKYLKSEPSKKNQPSYKPEKIKTPLKKVTDPPKKKYPKNYTKEDIKFLKDQNEDVVRDDDKVGMTKKQQRKHRRKVHQYNKNVAKPLNETQKKKIQQQLRGMDPKDPEAKLLRKMLNLKKNR